MQLENLLTRELPILHEKVVAPEIAFRPPARLTSASAMTDNRLK